ncbi:MAG: hypothetical protein ACXWUG_29200, partial [Polyangiales bacterium]
MPRPKRSCARMRAVLVSMALAGVPAATILLAPNVVLAASADDQLNAASNEITKVEADIPTATTIKGKTSFLRSAEDMIADGELLFRLRDYPRAILVFSQVEEQYPNNKPVYAEAVY